MIRVCSERGKLAILASLVVAAVGLAAVGLAVSQPHVTRAVQVGQVPLIVYSAQGYDMNEAAAFQKATGIKTEVLCDSTGPLLARIAAEGGLTGIWRALSGSQLHSDRYYHGGDADLQQRQNRQPADIIPATPRAPVQGSAGNE